MTCIRCTHGTCKKFGYYGKRRIQRWRCTSCKSTFSQPAPKLGTHYTDPETAEKVLMLMLEGMSIRAIERFTGIHRDAIISLMLTASEKARQVLSEKIKHIVPKYVQMDEMWGFVHTRAPNLHKGDPEEWGSTMVWLALDSETKLIITHHVGPRNGVSAHAFVSDLRARTDGRYQVSSDQFNAYVGAMREHFGQNVDFGQLHKIYGRINTDSWYGGGQVGWCSPTHQNRTPRMGQDFNFTCRTDEFKRENAPSQIHAIDECSQQNDGEHASCSDAIHCVLQFLPSEWGGEENTRDGGGDHRSHLDNW
jgi:transposase-like protein